MKGDPLDALAGFIDLPEGSFPELAVVIVGFLDAESGEQRMKYFFCGDANMATILGMTRMFEGQVLSMGGIG